MRVKELANSRMKPEISLDAKDLPAIKNWSLGKKYKLELEVEMVSQSKGEEWSPGVRARFKVLKVRSKDEG